MAGKTIQIYSNRITCYIHHLPIKDGYVLLWHWWEELNAAGCDRIGVAYLDDEQLSYCL